MRRLRSLLLAGTCAVIVAACGHAVAASAALKVTDLARLGEYPFRVDTVLGTQVRVYRDLAYSTRDDLPTEGKGNVSKTQWGGRHRSGTYFDVYVADAPFASAEMRAKMPVFVYMHGGTWSQSFDKDGYCIELLRRIAAKGYFVITMDYQLQNDATMGGAKAKREHATFADMLADVDTMITYLKTALPAAGLPTDKIVIGGDSAGGHLAMCYAWDQDKPGLSEVQLRHDLRISCVMSSVGPTDLAQGTLATVLLSRFGGMIPVPQAQSMRRLVCWLTDTDLAHMKGDAARAALRKWAPITLVKPSSCPAILAYACLDAKVSPGSTDLLVPVSNFVSLTNRLTAAGVSHDARLFMNTIHWNVGLNCEKGQGVEWISDRLEAFKTKHFDAPPPVGEQNPARAPRVVMNVVNFVRSLDPRHPRSWHGEALREEVALNRKYKFKNTILFQYDALIDPELRAEAAKSDPTLTEFGLWFEMSRPLNEAAGLPWRPKHDPSWDWDWFINPGFLMAYTHAERKALIDAAFARFKADFGAYPKVVGSWLLDAWSMDYMVKAYGVDAFCICREQDNTDAYGLRGGYSNGAYYPSRRNMLSAAVDMSNAVQAPVFKMLTPDPIYNYANPKARFPDYPFKSGCPTLEPVWAGGNVKSIVDWYFRIYTSAPGLLNLSYMQTGQENSFGWNAIKKGLPYQCERIAALRDAGVLTVETMGETARRFKADHPQNCPQTQVALEDWSPAGRNSVWYNSRFYRANLFRDGERVYFRDIHKMCDAFEEPFLDKVCTGWQANYFTPPVVDEFLFRTNGVSGVLAFDGAFARLDASAGANDTLAVVATRTDGSKVKVVFDERGIRVEGATLRSDYAPAFRQTISLRDGHLLFTFQGFRYKVGCKADVSSTDSGFIFRPHAGAIRLDLSLPDGGK